MPLLKAFSFENDAYRITFRETPDHTGLCIEVTNLVEDETIQVARLSPAEWEELLDQRYRLDVHGPVVPLPPAEGGASPGSAMAIAEALAELGSAVADGAAAAIEQSDDLPF
jgi:hypothetical protein